MPHTSKSKRQTLDPNLLREIVEVYAEGTFDRLFDVAWYDVEGFIQAARDYVPAGEFQEFAQKLRSEFR